MSTAPISTAELYKIIPDFPDYEVSNLGNVRNSKTNKIMKGSIKTYGLVVKLNKSKSFCVHHLVALLFIPKSVGDSNIIKHDDGNLFNNNVSNLVWVKENKGFCIYPNCSHRSSFGFIEFKPRAVCCVAHKSLGIRDKQLKTYDMLKDNRMKYIIKFIPIAYTLYQSKLMCNIKFIKDTFHYLLYIQPMNSINDV